MSNETHSEYAARMAVQSDAAAKRMRAKGYGEASAPVRALRNAERAWVSVVLYHVLYHWRTRPTPGRLVG